MTPAFTQANRPFTITTPLGADVFGVSSISGAEAISQPFDFRVDVFAAADATVEFDKLLGQGVTVAIGLPDGEKRYVNGIVRSVSKGGTERAGATPRTAYRLALVPKLWLLTRQARSRIFQQKTVKQILETVLTGLTTQFNLQGTYEPRDYCAQYRETDFDFAARLMEEEGIYYFFTHADGQHKMVIADVPLAHPALPTGATVKYDPGVGGALPDDRIHEWEKSQELTTGKITLWDASFELPGRNLEATTNINQTVQVGTVAHKLSFAANQQLELYDYPGGYAKRFDGVAPGGGDAASNVQKIFQDNARTVGIRARQVELGAIIVQGSSNCRQLVSGHKLTLSDHPDGDGEYVIVAVEHEARAADTGRSGGGSSFAYQNRFRCIPAALAFRTPRVTPRPRVDGCQTALVVGPQGEEIFTDKYGRVKVQFDWDRDGQKNASSSCWVRVASIWAGNRWGAVHIPRIGQEVVVDFLEGDPDRPIIVGSVYNANQMPPYTLPDNKTQSGIKSRSSLQGTQDMFNELRFEDKKDSEQVYFQAQKDLDAKVKNNETRVVWNDRTTTISNNDARTVGGVDKDGGEIGGNDTIVVKKGNRTVTLDEGNLTTTVTKGTLTTQVEGDETHTIKTGKQTVTVETGDRILHVKTGKLETNVDTGAYNTTVKTGNAKLDVTAGKYEISAAQEITFKVAGSTIKITPQGIEINGTSMIKLAAVTSQIEMSAAAVEVKSVATKVQASGALQMRAGGAAGLAGGGALVLEGGGMTQVNGGVVMIN